MQAMIDCQSSNQSLLKTFLSQLETDVRLQKSLAATAQKRQSEIETLKNELAKEKKSHSSTMSNVQSKLHKQMNEKQSEISKLKTKIDDQVKSFTDEKQKRDRRIENLQAEIKKLIARNSELEMNKENVRTQHLESEPAQTLGITGKYVIPQKKPKSLSAYRQQMSSGDKPNSEYEMLLSEKDAIIAEYLSGLDCTYFPL